MWLTIGQTVTSLSYEGQHFRDNVTLGGKGKYYPASNKSGKFWGC